MSPAAVWSDRRREAVRSEKLDLPALPPARTLIPGLRADEFGATLPSKNTLQVVQIRDVHLNLEAQRNIARAISELSRKGSIDLIALEGASGSVAIEPFRRFRRSDIVGAVSDYLLEQGRISGPVHAGLNMPSTAPPMVGVDDPGLYRANVRAFQDSRNRVAVCKADLLKRQRHSVEQAIVNPINPVLKNVHEVITGFHAGTVPLSVYIGKLMEGDKNATSENVRLFSDALRLEQKIDFSTAEQERTRMLRRLLARLSTAESKQLFYVASRVNLGDASAAVFYRYARQVCAAHGVRFDDEDGSLARYVRYLELVQRVNISNVINEFEKLERVAYQRAARSSFEQKWVRRSQRLALALKLVDFSLTAREWEDYQRLQVESAEQNDFRHFPDLALFERFYEVAKQRDIAMANNVLREMKQRGARRVVLVAGGFHSGGTAGVFAQAGVATVTFSPKVTSVSTAEGSRYLNVFLQEHTPLDRLFHGEKLFLPFPPDAGMKRELPCALPALTGDAADYARLTGDWATVVETHHASPDGYKVVYIPPMTPSHAITVSVETRGRHVTDINVRDTMPVNDASSSMSSVLAFIAKIPRIRFALALGILPADLLVLVLAVVGALVVVFQGIPLTIQCVCALFNWSSFATHRFFKDANPASALRFGRGLLYLWQPLAIATAKFFLPVIYWFYAKYRLPTSDPSEIMGYPLLSSTKIPEYGDFNYALPGLDTDDVVKLLRKGELSVHGSYRLTDGASSRWDVADQRDGILPKGGTRLQDRGGIVTLASADLRLEVTFKPSEDPNAIEYERGGVVKEPHKGPVALVGGDNDDKRPQDKDGDVVPYVVKNVFGIQKGVRVVVRVMENRGSDSEEEAKEWTDVDIESRIPEWGALEGSGIFLGCLTTGLSMLKQSGLSAGELFHLAVKIEADDLQKITGGQGEISALFDGINHTIWVQHQGKEIPFVMPLFSPANKTEVQEIEQHIAIAQAGIRYKNGRKDVDRSSTLTNRMWRDLLRAGIAQDLFKEELHLTNLYRFAMKRRDFFLQALTVMRLTEIRDEHCRLWMRIFTGKEKGDSELVKEMFDRVSNPENPLYGEYEVVRDLLRKNGLQSFDKQSIRDFFKKKDVTKINETSMYTVGPIGDFVSKAKKWGVAVMPMGAGGAGSNLLLISPYGSDHLEKFLAYMDCKPYNHARVEQQVREGDLIRTYIRPHIGFEPLQAIGAEELGLKLPPRPDRMFYSQYTGLIRPWQSGDWPSPPSSFNRPTPQQLGQKDRAKSSSSSAYRQMRRFAKLVDLALRSDTPVDLAWITSVLERTQDSDIKRLLTDGSSSSRSLPLTECIDHKLAQNFVAESFGVFEKTEKTQGVLEALVQFVEQKQLMQAPREDLETDGIYAAPVMNASDSQKNVIHALLGKVRDDGQLMVSPKRPLAILVASRDAGAYERAFMNEITGGRVKILTFSSSLLLSPTRLNNKNLDNVVDSIRSIKPGHVTMVLKDETLLGLSTMRSGFRELNLSFLFMNEQGELHSPMSIGRVLSLKNLVAFLTKA